MSVQKLLREQLNQKIPYFHGSKSPIPFEKFEPQSIGTGIVSSGQKYGGFFFTSQFENAEYYTEWFVVEVSIKNIEPSPIAQKNPPTKHEASGTGQENLSYFRLPRWCCSLRHCYRTSKSHK
jgi:hypothetical protein